MNPHLTDRDLLLAADGEPSAHLENCAHCRARLAEIEEMLGGLADARDLASGIPSAARARTLLRARLAQQRRAKVWRWRLIPAAACVCLAMIVGVRVNAGGPRPDARLTPGETRPVTLSEVCRTSQAAVVVRDIPADTQAQVLSEYGIHRGRPDQFEIDYLITPDLGGAESIRNLWPQPYTTRWNARVKDQLEQRLHQMVCSGDLDLATAQRDIAVDWIAAYKKYVGDRPM